jgi:predicted nucleotidyltransferase
MNRQHILDLLERSKPGLKSRFGVERLALFGSAVRDEATDNSDVDVLVAFDGPATSHRYFGVQFYLEDLLGHPVDSLRSIASASLISGRTVIRRRMQNQSLRPH